LIFRAIFVEGMRTVLHNSHFCRQAAKIEKLQQNIDVFSGYDSSVHLYWPNSDFISVDLTTQTANSISSNTPVSSTSKQYNNSLIEIGAMSVTTIWMW